MSTDADVVVMGRWASDETLAHVDLFFPYGPDASVVAAPDEPWPDELRARLLPVRGVKKLRGTRRLATLVLLTTGGGEHWIVRRAVGERLVALGRPGDVRLVPAPLVDASGWLDGDWVLLDVCARGPLDRDRAEIVPTTPGAPHASLVASVSRVSWSEASAPRAPMFRVAEAPELLCMRRPVAERWRELLGPCVMPIAPPYERVLDGDRPCAPLRPVGSLHVSPAGGGAPPIPVGEAAGRAAFDAYQRLARGEGRDGDRALACASPITAYFLAATVDGAPDLDTREGALRHPRYATLYARDVDRAPRDDTRRAALTERYAAHAYLAQVDTAPTAEMVEVLGAANVETMQDEIPRLRALRDPAAPRFPDGWSAPPGTRRRA